jgi:hypothetical protein
MKRIVLVSLMFLLLSAFGIAYAKVTNDDIVGLWLMDDSGKTVVDSSNNKFNGEIQGNDTKSVDGKFGKAISFTGDAKSWVLVPYNEKLALSQFSCCVWLKSQKMDWQVIVQRNAFDGGDGSGNNNYSLFTDPAGIVTNGFSDDAGGWNTVVSTTSVADGSWHHIVGSYDGKLLTIYIDGKKEAELAVKANPVLHKQPFVIGGDNRESANTKGAIDEVVITKRALTDDEIKEIIANGMAKISAVSSGDKLPAFWGQVKVNP